MRIIIDAFGGDNAPDEIIKGCRLAARARIQKDYRDLCLCVIKK